MSPAIHPDYPPVLLKGRSAEGTSESDFVQRIAQRDETAFGELYAGWVKPLTELAARIVPTRADAADVVQETFTQLWAKPKAFDPTRGRLWNWLATIVRHRAIDRLRIKTREIGRLEAAWMEHSATFTVLPPHALSRGETSRAIARALGALADAEQVVIRLAFFDELPHAEIALTLHLPLGTVKARIRRGLVKLRSSLARRAA